MRNSRAYSSLEFIPPALSAHLLACIQLAVEPDAPLALNNSLAVDLDVFPSPLPEHD